MVFNTWNPWSKTGMQVWKLAQVLASDAEFPNIIARQLAFRRLDCCYAVCPCCRDRPLVTKELSHCAHKKPSH